MLQLEIDANEFFNEVTQEFVNVKATTLMLEHSLVSLSKWESKWKRPFLTSNDKTLEETLDYVRCMTITQNVNPLVYSTLTSKNLQEVTTYIGDPMSATVFAEEQLKGKSETITSELIYYYMTALDIPFECQKWHLNRLLTLIRVCNVKNAPPKKMSAQETYQRNTDLNAERRAKYNTKG